MLAGGSKFGLGASSPFPFPLLFVLLSWVGLCPGADRCMQGIKGLLVEGGGSNWGGTKRIIIPTGYVPPLFCMHCGCGALFFSMLVMRWSWPCLGYGAVRVCGSLH